MSLKGPPGRNILPALVVPSGGGMLVKGTGAGAGAGAVPVPPVAAVSPRTSPGSSISVICPNLDSSPRCAFCNASVIFCLKLAC